MRNYDGLKCYYGDLHNHCAIGYGHGSLADAFQNARMQLDFAAVAVHAHWPDIPVEDTRLAALVDYHQQGFKKTAEGWPYVKETVAANNRPGRFVTFLAFEWHSRKYGDHNVYFNGSSGEIIRAADLEAMRRALRRIQAAGGDALLIPHHIGYKQGHRGINWQTFSPEFSPVVEIMSMHGASESPAAPYPYLHTMGPRHWHNTYQYGLVQGHLVGAIGSTDHHSAHPGSYGHGRLAVWATELSRNAIWNGIKARRTVALTGDKIELAFSINGEPLGAILPPAEERHISVAVAGGSALDYVEVLHNNRIIHRANVYEKVVGPQANAAAGHHKIHFEVGWGEKGVNVDWQVALTVVNGRLLGVEPRFRGHDIVAPQASDEESYAFSRWQQDGDNGLQFATRTWGNPATTAPATQGVGLEIEGDGHTLIRGTINGQTVNVALADLIEGPQSAYLGQFMTPAYYFHRAVPQAEYTCDIDFTHRANSSGRDWYYVRVRQYNGQWAWSSPIWVEA
jgi:hypothetical protein